ncbi:hypothetical protein FNF29_01871 [Cafeteria roenbergensis]|uniref:VWFA domain-containing protein n=1 Tax=Cafeteria roenbergensis TaxID=33653 RepID=A0A5A8CS11_CAFRO|nr:hypothetical protein FNF29_01871 [Cafeteria roenbergensis]|eukprot:KAA0155498.1 hypothetical protein FNF29_01871 [Cafeteria roenbergensis]
MASAEDAELAEMLMGTFVDDGVSDDEALELEQALAHSSKHEDTLTDEERWELLGSQESESAGWSATSAAEHAAELGSARMRVQEAVAEAAESEEDAAERRLAALDAFAAAASRANASAAEAFRQDREAELSEEGARALREAAAEAAALQSAFSEAAGATRHVAFVVDRSGSMTWRGMWVHVTRQLEKCLAALHPAGSFRVLAFNEAVSAHSTTLLPSVPTNHARALAWLERLEVRGGRTPKENFGPPLAAALRAPAGGAAAVEQIFLVSDADGTDYEAPMAAARSSGVQINCIYICPEGRPVPEGMLAIAAATGGNAIAVRTGSV